MSTVYYAFVDTSSIVRACRDPHRAITSVKFSDINLYHKGLAGAPNMILKMKEVKYEQQDFTAEGVDDQVVSFMEDSLVSSTPGSVDKDKDGFHIPMSLNHKSGRSDRTSSWCPTTRAPSDASNAFHSLETGR